MDKSYYLHALFEALLNRRLSLRRINKDTVTHILTDMKIHFDILFITYNQEVEVSSRLGNYCEGFIGHPTVIEYYDIINVMDKKRQCRIYNG